MANDKKRLNDDLRKKLEHLQSIQVQPSLYLARRFDEIRSQIDFDAEKAFQGIKHDGKESESKDKIKDARLEFIRILNAEESKLRRKLSGQALSPSEAYLNLEKKVVEFLKRSGEEEDINDLEDSYVELVMQILDLIHLKERKLFDSKTFFYMSSYRENQLGALIHFTDECLSDSELAFIK